MDFHDECRRVHRQGVAERSKLPYKDTGIPFRLIPYRRSSQRGPILKLDCGVDDAARLAIRKLIVPVFQAANFCAAILQSDSRMCDMSAFKRHFHIPPETAIEAVQEEYSRILSEQFDGSMENLPRQLWRDSILTTLKGPKVPGLLINSAYHGDENDQVIWGETEERTTGIVSILPDWWDPLVQ